MHLDLAWIYILHSSKSFSSLKPWYYFVISFQRSAIIGLVIPSRRREGRKCIPWTRRVLDWPSWVWWLFLLSVFCMVRLPLELSSQWPWQYPLLGFFLLLAIIASSIALRQRSSRNYKSNGTLKIFSVVLLMFLLGTLVRHSLSSTFRVDIDQYV